MSDAISNWSFSNDMKPHTYRPIHCDFKNTCDPDGPAALQMELCADGSVFVSDWAALQWFRQEYIARRDRVGKIIDAILARRGTIREVTREEADQIAHSPEALDMAKAGFDFDATMRLVYGDGEAAAHPKDDFVAEMEAITACRRILEPFRHEVRLRALGWLDQWRRDQMPDSF